MKRSLPQNILSHICSLGILFSLVPLGIFADTTTFGTTGNGPVSIISDISGNLYISNVNDNTVSKITPDGTSTTFATTG